MRDAKVNTTNKFSNFVIDILWFSKFLVESHSQDLKWFWQVYSHFIHEGTKEPTLIKK